MHDLPPGPRPVETPDGTDGPPSIRREPGRRPRLPLGSERRRPDGRDHTQPLSATCEFTFQPHVASLSVHVGVHVRGYPCPETSGNLWRSTPDGGNHVELCDRHVETCGPKGIRIHWGVPTFPGAASQTSSKGVTKGMVEGAGSGMAGVRDDIQQRVERRTPPSLSS